MRTVCFTQCIESTAPLTQRHTHRTLKIMCELVSGQPMAQANWHNTITRLFSKVSDKMFLFPRKTCWLHPKTTSGRLAACSPRVLRSPHPNAETHCCHSLLQLTELCLHFLNLYLSVTWPQRTLLSPISEILSYPVSLWFCLIIFNLTYFCVFTIISVLPQNITSTKMGTLFLLLNVAATTSGKASGTLWVSNEYVLSKIQE